MQDVNCKNCGALLGTVNTIHDGGAVTVSEFTCQCGHGVRSHYHPKSWACGNYNHPHAGNCRCLKLCKTCKQPESAHGPRIEAMAPDADRAAAIGKQIAQRAVKYALNL